MRIYVDADACPAVIKDILCRAAIRTKTQMFFVANKALSTPPSPFIKSIRVSQGFDVADNHIVELLTSGDLVITADIPLADAVVEKGGLALNPRGELYSANNIKQHLSARNFNDSLRGSGVITGGPAKFSTKETQAFANQLDKLLSAALK